MARRTSPAADKTRRPNHLALFGGQGAGKTVFLAGLYYLLTEGQDRELVIDQTATETAEAQFSDAQGRPSAMMAELIADLVVRRYWPAGTAFPREFPLVVKTRSPRGNGQPADAQPVAEDNWERIESIHFRDIPGGHFEEREAWETESRGILRQIRQADGCLFLIPVDLFLDPSRLPHGEFAGQHDLAADLERRRQILTNMAIAFELAEKSRRHGLLNRVKRLSAGALDAFGLGRDTVHTLAGANPIAVCFTKADLVDTPAYFPGGAYPAGFEADPIAWFKAQLGRLPAVLEGPTAAADVRYLLVSATGGVTLNTETLPTPGAPEATPDNPADADTEPSAPGETAVTVMSPPPVLQPRGIKEALLFLLNRRRVYRRKRGRRRLTAAVLTLLLLLGGLFLGWWQARESLLTDAHNAAQLLADTTVSPEERETLIHDSLADWPAWTGSALLAPEALQTLRHAAQEATAERVSADRRQLVQEVTHLDWVALEPTRFDHYAEALADFRAANPAYKTDAELILLESLCRTSATAARLGEAVADGEFTPALRDDLGRLDRYLQTEREDARWQRLQGMLQTTVRSWLDQVNAAIAGDRWEAVREQLGRLQDPYQRLALLASLRDERYLTGTIGDAWQSAYDSEAQGIRDAVRGELQEALHGDDPGRFSAARALVRGYQERLAQHADLFSRFLAGLHAEVDTAEIQDAFATAAQASLEAEEPTARHQIWLQFQQRFSAHPAYGQVRERVAEALAAAAMGVKETAHGALVRQAENASTVAEYQAVLAAIEQFQQSFTEIEFLRPRLPDIARTARDNAMRAELSELRSAVEAARNDASQWPILAEALTAFIARWESLAPESPWLVQGREALRQLQERRAVAAYEEVYRTYSELRAFIPTSPQEGREHIARLETRCREFIAEYPLHSTVRNVRELQVFLNRILLPQEYTVRVVSGDFPTRWGSWDVAVHILQDANENSSFETVFITSRIEDDHPAWSADNETPLHWRAFQPLRVRADDDDGRPVLFSFTAREMLSIAQITGEIRNARRAGDGIDDAFREEFSEYRMRIEVTPAPPTPVELPRPSE